MNGVFSDWGDLLDLAEHFGARGLVEADVLLRADGAYRLEQPERAHANDIGGVNGLVEGHPDVALSAEVV